MMEASGKDFSFLGREFLTWLWFKSEQRGGAIMLPGEGDVVVAFVRRIILSSGEGEYSETVSCQGLHSDLKEGKEALRKGKKIKEARIKLDINTDEYEFTFKADSFQFQTMKLPTSLTMTEEEEDKEGRILERIYQTEAAVGTMETFFSLFLEKRLSPAWQSEEIPLFKKWLAE